MENTVLVYDYKTVKVSREMEVMVADTYKNLGYEQTGANVCEGSPFYVNLSFKRDRKIEHKAELVKLQEKIDAVLNNIELLQRKKKSAGTAEGVTTGVVGALTLGGGMSMVMTLEGVGYLIGGIALGVVGLAVAISSYFIARSIRNKNIDKIQPILESEYDKLSDLCEQANNLISK